MFKIQSLLRSLRFPNINLESLVRTNKARFSNIVDRVNLTNVSNEFLLENYNNLLKSHKLVVFVKDSYDPLTQYAIELLKFYRVEYDIVDLSVTKMVKIIVETHLNMTDLPQFYLEGELIGNLEMVQEKHENGLLQRVFEDKGILKDFLKI